jgi:NitT/TauT family transport system permease protein
VAITFFLVFFNVLAGVRALDVKLVRMAQILGATESQVARKIIWPGAVPYIFAGLRTATPYAIGGAVIAELISSNRGLGYLVQLSAMNFDNKSMFAALTVIAAIVVVMMWGVNTLERRLLRWRPKTGFAAGGALANE